MVSFGGRIQLKTKALHCTEPFISTLPYGCSNVERDVKHQIFVIEYFVNMVMYWWADENVNELQLYKFIYIIITV